MSSSSDNTVFDFGSSTPSYVDGETSFERYLDYVLGLSFLITAGLAFSRMRSNTGASTTATETTVVTAFYSLIFATSVCRSLYFLVPASVWQPSYTPSALYAFDSKEPWIRYTLAECTVSAGSLCLFSIFILILVYWSDILQKYYNPGSRRNVPMRTFLGLVATLVSLELINLVLFLCQQYTTEGMILFHAVLLSATSLICVIEITIFSRKFQNVLQTLGAINQVSTDSQVRRIVWITVTGNVFFVSRALLEMIFCVSLVGYWWKNHTVSKAFSHTFWDVYTILKYFAELAILGLMLHILQSRFSNQSNGSSDGAAPSDGNNGYQKVPDAVAV